MQCLNNCSKATTGLVQQLITAYHVRCQGTLCVCACGRGWSNQYKNGRGYLELIHRTTDRILPTSKCICGCELTYSTLGMTISLPPPYLNFSSAQSSVGCAIDLKSSISPSRLLPGFQSIAPFLAYATRREYTRFMHSHPTLCLSDDPRS